MISTGLSTLEEIDRAVRTIEEAGNRRIVILHCVSIYPPDDAQVHLRNMDMLRDNYPDYPVGFSDHTLGTLVPIAAIARGAAVIEKHFTLDKNMFGWDHKVSATVDEMAAIVEAGQRLPTVLGDYRRTLRQACARGTARISLPRRGLGDRRRFRRRQPNLLSHTKVIQVRQLWIQRLDFAQPFLIPDSQVAHGDLAKRLIGLGCNLKRPGLQPELCDGILARVDYGWCGIWWGNRRPSFRAFGRWSHYSVPTAAAALGTGSNMLPARH